MTVTSAAHTKAPAEKKMKPEKAVRKSFRLATSERKRIKLMCDDVKAVGRRPSGSELVRAAVAQLSSRSGTEILAMVDALAPLKKRKSESKKRR